MKIKSRRDYLVNLESVAMTDIVLNMFIFFFISFSLLSTFNLARAQKIKIKLPEAAHTSPIDERSPAYISITNEGLMYFGRECLTRKELKARIYAAHKDNPGLSVVLSADKLVRFKDIVAILDMLTEVGIKNLNIAAAKEQ